MNNMRCQFGKTNESDEVSISEVMQETFETIKNWNDGVFTRLDYQQAKLVGIIESIDALGGKLLALEICDILEQFDEQEESLPSREQHRYVANFDQLATGVIEGWSN